MMAAHSANINVKWLNLWIINDFFKDRPTARLDAEQELPTRKPLQENSARLSDAICVCGIIPLESAGLFASAFELPLVTYQW